MKKRERPHGQGREGRMSRARSVVHILQMALDELTKAEKETDPKMLRERVTLARRLVLDGVACAQREIALG